MKKRNWKTNMLIGAAVGAMVTLFHKETRQGAKACGRSMLNELGEYRRHPSKAVHDLKSAVERLDRYADTFAHELESAESLFKNEGKKSNDLQSLH